MSPRSRARPWWRRSARPAQATERVRQVAEVDQLRGPRKVARLAEPVDPDRWHAHSRGRLDVVEEAGGDVDVARALGARFREEALPVPGRGLVGAGVGRGDQEV